MQNRIRYYYCLPFLIALMITLQCNSCTGSRSESGLNLPVGDSAQYSDNELFTEIQQTIKEFKPDAEIDPNLLERLKVALATAIKDSGRSTLAAGPPQGENHRIRDLQISESGGSYVFTWAYLNLGDYDRNGQTNIADLTPVGKFFGATSEDANWNQASVADGDGNGVISIADVTPIGQNFSCNVLGYRIKQGNGQTGPWPGAASFDLADILDRNTGICSSVLSPGAEQFFSVNPYDADDHEGMGSNVVSPDSSADPIDEGLGSSGGIQYGDPIGEFSGISAFSNSPVNHPSPEPYGQYGYEYQCVQYCRAFSAQRWGFDIGKGHAYMFWDKPYQDARVVGYENGGSVPPQPGDIVCWSGGKYGHVAIVSAVPAGDPASWSWINVIEQNVAPHESAIRKLNLEGAGNVDIPDRGMRCEGWIRPKSTGPANPPQNVHASEGDPSYPGSVNLYWEAPATGPVPTSYGVRRIGIGFSDSAEFTVGSPGFVDDTVMVGAEFKYQYYVASNSLGYPSSQEVAAPELGWAYGGGSSGYSVTGQLDKPNFWEKHAVNLAPGGLTTMTNSVGHYLFTDLADGDYTVTPAPLAGYHWDPPSRSVTVNGDDVADVNFAAIIDDPGNQNPVATLNAFPQSGPAPLSVDFTAIANDPDGSIADYEWDLDGDGNYGEAGDESAAAGYSSASTDYVQTGNYQARVRVTDNKGATAEDDVLITVGSSGYSEVEDNDSTTQANSFVFGQPFTGHIGPGGYDGDTKDYLKFTCLEGALITGELLFNDSTGKLQVSLRDANDSEIELFAYSGNKVPIAWGLKAGTYFLRIQRYVLNSGFSEYTLNVGLEYPGYDEVEDNDSTSIANPLTFPILVSDPFHGHIGQFGYDGDEEDYLEFTCAEGALISGLMLFDNSTGALQISLRNSGDTQIHLFPYEGDQVPFSWGLKAGTYYLRVQRYVLNSGYSDYTFDATLTYPGYDEVEDNDATSTANLISFPILVADPFTGHIGDFGYDGDDEDYLKFTCGGTATLNGVMTFNDATGGLQISLRDSGDNQIELFQYSGDTVNFNRVLNAGTYYLRVQRYVLNSGFSDYSIVATLQ